MAAVLPASPYGPWTAFGTGTSPSGVPTAEVWTSADGTGWTGTALDPGGPPARVEGAARYRGMTVVVGSVGEGGDEQAAAWVSRAPGAAFTPAVIPATDGSSTMAHVTAGAVGVFATGTVDGRFALWSSTGGDDWSEQPEAEKTLGGTPGTRVETLMAQNDVVYAAGSVQSGAYSQAAVWATGDGLHWGMVGTAQNQFAGPGDRVIYSLASLGNAVVAVGGLERAGAWSPVSWVSPDGASWSPPSTSFAGLASPPPGSVSFGPSGGAVARAAAAVPVTTGGIPGSGGLGTPSVIAVGGGPGEQGLWTTTDGLHWSQVPLPGSDATATGWRATMVATSGAATVVADGDPGQPHLLTDGSAGWQEPSVDPAVFGVPEAVAEPVSILSWGSRLVLTVQVTTAPQAVGNVSATTVYLASPDGSGWTPLAGPEGVPPTLPTPGADAQMVDGQWVSVASAGSVAQAWASPTGASWTPAGTLPVPAASSGLSSPDTTANTGPAGSGGSGSASGGSGSDLVAVGGLCSVPAVTDTPASTPAPGTTPGTGPAPASSSSTAASSTGPEPPGTASPSGMAVAVGSLSQAVPAAPGPAGPGSSLVPVPGRMAAAWTRQAPGGWKRAPVTPSPPAGVTESMSGCMVAPVGTSGPSSPTGNAAGTPSGNGAGDTVPAGTDPGSSTTTGPGSSSGTGPGSSSTTAVPAAPSGLVAYGVSASSSGAPVPALWRSTTGATWTRADVTGFAPGSPTPLTGMAASGPDWITIANPDPTDGPLPGGGTAGPAAWAPTVGAVAADPGLEDGQEGLWVSSDGGDSWEPVDTAVSPWLGTVQSEADLVAYAGSVPVVVGSVDGQLAVWTGTGSGS